MRACAQPVLNVVTTQIDQFLGNKPSCCTLSGCNSCLLRVSLQSTHKITRRCLVQVAAWCPPGRQMPVPSGTSGWRCRHHWGAGGALIRAPTRGQIWPRVVFPQQATSTGVADHFAAREIPAVQRRACADNAPEPVFAHNWSQLRRDNANQLPRWSRQLSSHPRKPRCLFIIDERR